MTQFLTKAILLYLISFYKQLYQENSFSPHGFIFIGNKDDFIKLKGREIKVKNIPSVKFLSESLFIYFPKQEKINPLVYEVSLDDEYLSNLETQFAKLAEIHSHGEHQAFYSSSDKELSKDNSLKIVLGKILEEVEVHFWGLEENNLKIEEGEAFQLIRKGTYKVTL